MIYSIAVRNDQTDEILTIIVEAELPLDAQGDALHYVFQHYGWRLAVALPPVDNEASGLNNWEQERGPIVLGTTP